MSTEGGMSIEGGWRKAMVTALIAGLLAAPVWARETQPVRDVTSLQEPDRFTEQESAQDRRDREQEARDREQEKKDREQEKKDREQERIERMQELYDGGRESLDEGRYQQAEQKFDELARMNSSLADAGVCAKSVGQEERGFGDDCRLEKAISAEPLEERCGSSGDRSPKSFGTASESGWAERRRPEAAGASRSDEL